jgi:hypothetical protein
VSITVAKFRDVAEGTQPGQFMIGEREPVTSLADLDRIWVKYTGNEPPYALRDPSMDERRVLFELEVVKVATFGRP